MSALPKDMAESYAAASQPVAKDGEIIRFPQGGAVPPHEIIRRRQYAAQMEMWLAWKAVQDTKKLGNTRQQHQPR